MWADAQHAGAVCTTCNPQYTADELANQLKDSDATSVIAFSPLLNKVRPIDSDGERYHAVMVVPVIIMQVQAAIRAAGGRAAIKRLYVVGTSTCDEAKPFDHLLACPHAPPRVSINPKIDIAALPYSRSAFFFPVIVDARTHRFDLLTFR